MQLVLSLSLQQVNDARTLAVEGRGALSLLRVVAPINASVARDSFIMFRFLP